MHIHIYIYTCMYTCMYEYIYTYKYIHTHVTPSTQMTLFPAKMSFSFLLKKFNLEKSFNGIFGDPGWAWFAAKKIVFPWWIVSRTHSTVFPVCLGFDEHRVEWHSWSQSDQCTMGLNPLWQWRVEKRGPLHLEVETLWDSTRKSLMPSEQVYLYGEGKMRDHWKMMYNIHTSYEL